VDHLLSTLIFDHVIAFVAYAAKMIKSRSYDNFQITGAQMRAGRALLRWSADELASRSRLGVATVRRAEAEDGTPTITAANAQAIGQTLEAAGVEFIPENGGGPGVRLRAKSP